MTNFTNITPIFYKTAQHFSHFRDLGIGNLVNNSSWVFALLVIGLSLTLTSNVFGQTYDTPITVNVNNGGRTVGTPGYVSVDAQRIDNATHNVSSMPNYNNMRLEGYVMVGSDEVYYG